MNLWTPSNPRPRIARPELCGRCGCLRQEFSRDDRWRRYLSMHRICCCGGCPESVDVTVSGVDAARCTGCYADAQGDGHQHIELAVDGSYTVSFDSRSGDTCRFDERFNVGDSAFRNIYEGDSDCSDPASSFNDLNGVRIIVEYDLTTSKLSSIKVNPKLDIDAGFELKAYSWSGTGDFGVSLSNQLSCAPDQMSNGGTVSVASP